MMKTSTPTALTNMSAPLAGALKGGLEQASRAWTNSFELGLSYMAALSKARGPEDVIAANASYMNASLEAMTKSMSAFAKGGTTTVK